VKILLTGFNAFHGVKVNPSEEVALGLAERAAIGTGVALMTSVLPTEYVAATRRIRQLFRSARPDAVLCLGVATKRDRISLERVALNLDDDPTPDNAGVVRRGRKIVRGGPDVYWTTLPLDAMLRALRGARVRAYISNHAGTFLCNHLFYAARHEAARARRAISCGFIHIPGAKTGRTGRRSSPERLIRSIELCLEVLARERPKKRSPRR
jgi:pyroglutamyl-peptidase